MDYSGEIDINRESVSSPEQYQPAKNFGGAWGNTEFVQIGQFLSYM